MAPSTEEHGGEEENRNHMRDMCRETKLNTWFLLHNMVRKQTGYRELTDKCRSTELMNVVAPSTEEHDDESSGEVTCAVTQKL